MFFAFLFLLFLTIPALGKAMEVKNFNETAFYVQGGHQPDDINELAKFVVSIRFKVVEDAEFGYGLSHNCGGTIIGDRTILTAAHCVIDKIPGGEVKFKPSQLVVVAGAAYRFMHQYDEGYAKTYRIRKIITHRDYYSKTSKHDIALLILTEDIVFNERTQKIEITNLQTKPCERCTAVGWGQLFFKGPRPNIIQYATLYVYNDDFCEINHQRDFHKNGELCVTGVAGTQVCTGDSGGPLICDGKVTGIATMAFPCMESQQTLSAPSLFTKVYYYRDWIAKNSASIKKGGWTFGILFLLYEIFSVLTF